MSTRFQKKVEDFVCEHCGFSVVGNGFTNHCPKCLWGKHVDMYPGDRAAICKGLMEPLAVLLEKGEYVISHRCTRCGLEKKNRAAADDNFEAVLGGGANK